MNETTARAILRIIALTTILVGVSLTISSILTLLGAQQAISSDDFGGMNVKVSSSIAGVGLTIVFAYASIILCGALFYKLSPRLATAVLSDPN